MPCFMTVSSSASRADFLGFTRKIIDFSISKKNIQLFFKVEDNPTLMVVILF